MIPFLPEVPGPHGVFHASGALPPAAFAAEGAGLDFAGLLGAAFAPPAPPSLPPEPLPASGTVNDAKAGAALPAAYTPPAFIPAPVEALPGGKIVPDRGASLPHSLAAVPAEPTAAPVATTVRPLLRDDAPLADPVAAETVSAALKTDPASPTHADIAPPLAEDAAPDAAPQSPDPALLAALVPPVVAPPVASPAPAPARLPRAGLIRPAGGDLAPLPARVTLPPAPAAETPTGDTPDPQGTPATPSSPAPTPAQSPAPLLAAWDSAPPPALATPIAPPPPAPAPERIEAPRAPAPQQETTIAQVGDLREALRSARPEITLRHAEFGFVSLRLEQPAPEQWRAVLASRDPGFVPAIQAALAERAVAAASASADTGQFMGQNGTPQNGSGDQRYGASPNGGQGGLSPYMGQSGGQSGGRDGEAAPDHRRPSTAAALAARGQEGAAEGSGSETRGLFA
ncbi:MAG: hypothetical protein EDM03_14255 [Porphyrobacter sp. IPPAS B-1204]|nr:MAG: hypothetical protein EDM03_14255 [Porphyrobacter sp. IPPAS B-1204]